jgi:anti-anti-sigma regulatory factor
MALNRSRAAGGSIVVRNPSAAVMRILEITGLVSVVPIEGEAAPTFGPWHDKVGEGPIRSRKGTQ